MIPADGGHYVPNYAKKILDQNQAKAGKNIPLKGFAVGNAWTVPAVRLQCTAMLFARSR